MIMQNPNIETPNTPQESLANFRSIDDDWTKITNTNYWKLISKVIGNIDIKSWSGDINIETKGTLGNAGNINILARNKHGALPGYRAGNVTIKSDTPFRVFTDPRDLFLDTHLTGKFTGQFSWFSSSVTTNTLTVPPITVKPLENIQLLLNALGINISFGFANINQLNGGCPYCITDAILQAAVDLNLFKQIPYKDAKLALEGPCKTHKFNALNQSIIHKEDNIIAGATSLLNMTSNGFGHTVDTFGLDEIYADTKFGSITINRSRNI